MADISSIPQNNNGSASKNKNKVAEQHIIEEVMRHVYPEIFTYCGDVHINIAVHIHCCDLADFPDE